MLLVAAHQQHKWWWKRGKMQRAVSEQKSAKINTCCGLQKIWAVGRQ
jgi:hypothetical protein